MNSKSDSDSADGIDQSAGESGRLRDEAGASPGSANSGTEEKSVASESEESSSSLKVPFTFFKVTFFKEEVNQKTILMVLCEKFL